MKFSNDKREKIAIFSIPLCSTPIPKIPLRGLSKIVNLGIIVLADLRKLSTYCHHFSPPLDRTIYDCHKSGFHMIAEKNVQQSLRSYGNHSSAIVAIAAIISTTIAEIDFSPIVAIVWKPAFIYLSKSPEEGFIETFSELKDSRP